MADTTNNKHDLKKYMMFLDMAKKVTTKEIMASLRKDDVMPLIDDISFDILEANKIVSNRLFKVTETILNIDSKTARNLLSEYGNWLSKNNLISEGSLGELSYPISILNISEEFIQEHKDFLDGRMVIYEITNTINKDPLFIATSKKLLEVANNVGKKVAIIKGLNPSSVSLDNITIRNVR
jgi:predicted DNA-binding ArsR family transcriptional regulator